MKTMNQVKKNSDYNEIEDKNLSDIREENLRKLNKLANGSEEPSKTLKKQKKSKIEVKKKDNVVYYNYCGDIVKKKSINN
jgi:hypothetical protein